MVADKTEALTNLLQRARGGLKRYTKIGREAIDQASEEEIFDWIKRLKAEGAVGSTFANTILTGLAEMAIEELGFEVGKIWMEKAQRFLASCNVIVNSDTDQIEALIKLRNICGLAFNPGQRQEAKSLIDQHDILFGKMV